MTAAELAKQTKTDERYVREWAASQAAGGYLTYEPTIERFGMTEEQILTLAREDGPAFLPGAFELALGSLAAVPRITELFGQGREWDGSNMTKVSSTDVRNSSVRATRRI